LCDIVLTREGSGIVASLEATLRSVPFLASLSEDRLRKLVERGQVVTAGANQVLFREGDEADCLYVVLAGQVRLYRRDDQGHEVELGLVPPGQFFGEMALIDGRVRSASAATVTPCTFFVLDRPGFLNLLAGSPEALSQLLTHLTDSVRKATGRYVQEEVAQERLRVEMEIARHRSLAQMVAGVAHEVNTPLGIISTAASVIRRELTSETLTALTPDGPARTALADALEATELVQKNVARAHTLIRSFKNVSVGEITDTKETMDLAEALAETLHLFSINARKAKLTVELDTVAAGQDRAWVGHRGHLSRVILNLLTNVERYAYPEGIGGRVVVSLGVDHERRPPAFVITVQDFGRGIPPEDLPRICDPFFTTGRGQGGTGLGMTIVHTLVTSTLQGALAIESELGRGTTVRVTVPQTVTA
jgi:signal transduction histidine kinase